MMYIPVYQLSLSENQVIGRNVSLQVYCLRLFVVVYKLVIVVLTLEWYCVPVYQVRNAKTRKL